MGNQNDFNQCRDAPFGGGSGIRRPEDHRGASSACAGRLSKRREDPRQSERSAFYGACVVFSQIFLNGFSELFSSRVRRAGDTLRKARNFDIHFERGMILDLDV